VATPTRESTDAELARLYLERDELQQRLTAADEELDQCHSMALMIEEKEWAEHVGKGTISSRVESAFTQLHNELTEARQGLAAADERADVLVGLLHKAHPFTNDVAHDVDVWLEIEAELKLVNGDCHHGYASILECPECGEPYQ
jgi:chromosome segregation ATPase